MGKRSIRFAAAALAGVLAAFVAPTRPAEACSCVGLSAAAYMKGADLVFLGRAGKEVTRGESTVQPLAVLHALKGKPGTTYSLERKVLSPCERHYDEGEVAIVFVSGARLGSAAATSPSRCRQRTCRSTSLTPSRRRDVRHGPPSSGR